MHSTHNIKIVSNNFSNAISISEIELWKTLQLLNNVAYLRLPLIEQHCLRILIKGNIIIFS